MEGPGPLCLAYAELDHLVFLGRGDAALTRRAKAASKLSDILDVFPEDGPSQFYLRRCEAYVLSPPDEPWQPTVRIDQK